jgi:uncharacterized protein (UPF0332 family)
VSEGDTSQFFRARSIRALESARVLLREGDAAGAGNRAYYAMFDAVHAALRITGIVSEGPGPKTHNGLISLFSKELVQTGQLDVAYSKALNKVQQIRLQGDYAAGPLSLEDATRAVEQAETFVAGLSEALPLR